MDMQQALLARLVTADAAVADLAADRVYWVQRPQSSALPAVTLQVISDPRPQHLEGFDDLRETRVQVDAWAATYGEVQALSEAAIAALVPERTSNGIIFNRAIVDSVRDLSEPTETLFIYRKQIDLLIWWQAE